MSVWLRIGGYPATEIAAHTPPKWETWADGGSGSASWEFALTRRSQHQALRVGSLVEVMAGPLPLFTGLLSQPDRTTWQCTAYGLASAAKKYLALDGTLSNTRDVADAIAQAQATGWQATDPDALTGVASGDETGNPITLADLLDARALDLGHRWGVNGKGRLFMRADPTVPQWIASPDSAAFGTTDEDRANTLYGRYLDSGTSTYLTATAGTGDAPQAAEDLTDRGAMTNAQAVAVLDGMLTARSETAWTNGVTLTRDQLQTIGGTPASLLSVRAGQLMRTLGLAYGARGIANDVVIGKTRYDAATPHQIYVEPVNTAPRTHRDVLAGKATR